MCFMCRWCCCCCCGSEQEDSIGVVIGGPDHATFRKVTDTSQMSKAGKDFGLGDVDIKAAEAEKEKRQNLSGIQPIPPQPPANMEPKNNEHDTEDESSFDESEEKEGEKAGDTKRIENNSGDMGGSGEDASNAGNDAGPGRGDNTIVRDQNISHRDLIAEAAPPPVIIPQELPSSLGNDVLLPPPPHED